MTWTGEGDISLTATPTISAIPVRLALFVSQPIGSKLDLTADAGATLSPGSSSTRPRGSTSTSMTGWKCPSAAAGAASPTWVSRAAWASNTSSPASWASSSRPWDATPSFKNFDSVTARNENSGGSPETTVGKLYIADYTFDEGSYSLFTIEETPPVDDPPNVTYREPKIDLSGFSLQAGFRIRL